VLAGACMNYNIENIQASARGDWKNILGHFGISGLGKKHSSCPICGGNDRFRFDDKGGEGTWYCSQGEANHALKKNAGDGLALLTDSYNGDLKKAITDVANYLGLKPASEAKPVNILKPNVWYEIYQIEKDKIKKFKFVKVWDWFVDNEGFKWYLARSEYKDKDGIQRKIVYRIKYNSLAQRFEQGTPSQLWTVLGNPEKNKILIVEGEKTRDAADILFKNSEFDVITWIGGAQVIHKTDWTILKDKEVYFWPDNDQVGLEAVKKIAKIAKSFASEMWLINPPAKEAQGWDLADALDAGWTPAFTYNYLLDNIQEINQETDPKEDFKILGYDGGNYYFLSKLQKTVLSISESQFTPERLYRLKPKQAWFDEYADPETGKVFWSDIYADLIEKSIQKGRYNEQIIRGTGCFIDRNRKVFNLGNKVLLDGELVDNFEFDTNYIYENRTEINIDVSKPLDEMDLHLLYLTAKSFSWVNPVNADLFMGGLILAPICGALRWRPHLWITGAAGSGKSTIMENLILNLLDGICEGLIGNTTEAGIRQQMQSDARPIVFEESEQDTFKSKKIMEENIALARLASTETRTRILKGSASGVAVSYAIRAMFILVSVHVGLKQKADKDRITVLSLDPKKTTVNFEDVKKLLKKIDKIENLAGKWLRFVYDNVLVIRQNMEIFSDILAETYTKRFGDQYGSLLAGRAVIDHAGKVFSIEEAREYLKRFDLTPFENIILDTQEKDILQTILQSDISIELDRTYRLTIAQIIDHATSFKNIEDKDKYKEKLLSIGIKIENDKVYFSTKSKMIEKFCGLSGNFWTDYLQRIPGLKKTKNPIRFGKSFARSIAIEIPIDKILDKENIETEEVLFP
jgi:putative DNA primase/helicase